jgi:hypothetical protein
MSSQYNQQYRTARSRLKLKLAILAMAIWILLPFEASLATNNTSPERKDLELTGQEKAPPAFNRRAININILSNLNLGDVLRAYRGSEPPKSVRSTKWSLKGPWTGYRPTKSLDQAHARIQTGGWLE